MSLYKFETNEFGISDTGIHLLRSRFNYETIDFHSIDKIYITKGRQVGNWFLLLIIGLVFFLGGLLVASFTFYEYFFTNDFHVFYIQQFLVPILPIILGALSIYFSLKIGLVIKITIKNKTQTFPIESLRKKSQINELKNYFMLHDSTNNKFESNID